MGLASGFVVLFFSDRFTLSHMGVHHGFYSYHLHHKSSLSTHVNLGALSTEVGRRVLVFDQVFLCRRLDDVLLTDARWLKTGENGSPNQVRSKEYIFSVCLFVPFCLSWAYSHKRQREKGSIRVTNFFQPLGSSQESLHPHLFLPGLMILDSKT